MTLCALTLISYVWHYLVARLIYDDLLRPLSHGALPLGALALGMGLVGFALGRFTRRGAPPRRGLTARRRG